MPEQLIPALAADSHCAARHAGRGGTTAPAISLTYRMLASEWIWRSSLRRNLVAASRIYASYEELDRDLDVNHLTTVRQSPMSSGRAKNADVCTPQQVYPVLRRSCRKGEDWRCFEL